MGFLGGGQKRKSDGKSYLCLTTKTVSPSEQEKKKKKRDIKQREENQEIPEMKD